MNLNSLRARLLTPIVIGLIVRLLYLLIVPQREPLSDDAFYWGTAQMLAAGNGYTMDGVVAATEYMPGFPMLLAPIIFLFGANLFIARLFLVLLSAATIFFIERIASYWFSPQIGRLSAWGFALFPPLWFYSSAILSETPAIFFTALLLDRANALHQNFSWRDSLLAALCYTALFYTKPELVMLGPLYLLVSLLQKKAFPFRATLVMGVVGALCLAPWTYRNWTNFHELIPLKTTGGKLVYWASLHPPADTETDPRYQEALKKFLIPAKPGATSARFSSEGFARIKADPIPYIVETFTVRTKMLFIGSQCEATVSLSRSFGDLKSSREWFLLALKLSILGLQSLVSLLGIAGLLMGKDEEKKRTIVRAHFVANTLVYATLLGVTRYSMVLMPMLIPHAMFVLFKPRS